MNAIQSNYIFASLNAQDLNSLALCMEIVDVSAGENIITQGAAYLITDYLSVLSPFDEFT